MATPLELNLFGDGGLRTIYNLEADNLDVLPVELSQRVQALLKDKNSNEQQRIAALLVLASQNEKAATVLELLEQRTDYSVGGILDIYDAADVLPPVDLLRAEQPSSPPILRLVPRP